MSRSSQLGWSELWSSRQCNNICAAECWCVLTESSPERERGRGKEGGGFTCPGHTTLPPPIQALSSPICTRSWHTQGIIGVKTMIHFSPRYATCTKLESPTKETFEMSRVLNYHLKRERDDFFSRVRGGRGRKQVWTSLWIELLKGRVSTDWDWMDASPQAERCT